MCLGKLIYFYINYFDPVGEKVPSIPRIQQFIESAWTSGKKPCIDSFSSSI